MSKMKDLLTNAEEAFEKFIAIHNAYTPEQPTLFQEYDKDLYIQGFYAGYIASIRERADASRPVWENGKTKAEILVEQFKAERARHEKKQ